MCGRKSRRLGAFLLLFVLLCPLTCYADVRLTDSQAREMLTEIQESKKELIESRKELEKLNQELTEVKNTCNEQKIYYEKRLNEAEKKNNRLEKLSTATGTSTVIFVIFTVALLLF